MIRPPHLLALVACAVLGTAFARAEVTVDHEPAQIVRKTFDPNHPPSDMPPLNGKENAMTESHFECNVSLAYNVLSHDGRGPGCKTSMKVRGVTVTLQLRIVLWLPDGASAKLAAHEEGHRQITERMYAGAESAALDIAKTFDGKTLTGEGADCEAAEKQATQAAAARFCQSYLQRIASPSARVNEIYDDLTAHGTRAEPTEDDAIRQAFEKAARESENDRRDRSSRD